MWTKTIALLTSICFLVSFICAPAVEGAVSIARETSLRASMETAAKTPAAAFGLSIPSSIGRVTGYTDCGSDVVVVNIQDLHCNAEVQRNISKIVDALVARHGAQRVFVEGAAGVVDTTWLSALPNAQQRTAVARALLESGRLTGSEYYAIANDRPSLLYGLEDERLHRENIVRLGRLLDRRPVYEKKVKELSRVLTLLKNRYFSTRNRKFNRIVTAYHAGRVPSQKYYAVLTKYALDIINRPEAYNPAAVIRLRDYPNVSTYGVLLHAGKHLRYQRAAEQMQGLLQNLKSTLPYSEYRTFLEETDNFAHIDQVVRCLAPVLSKHHISIDTRYPDLARLLAYVEQNRNLNPVALLDEEKKLTAAIRLGLSRTSAELEVSFLADFFGYYGDYLRTSLSADDYRYFTARFDKFNKLWQKYTYENGLSELTADYAVLNKFYAVNEERNTCFLRNMAESIAVARQVSGTGHQGSRLLVTVTGGFHTAGITQLLTEQHISSLTITPNVTTGTGRASRIYADLARQQAQAFGSSSLQMFLSSYKAKVKIPSVDKIVLEIAGSATVSLKKKGDHYEIFEADRLEYLEHGGDAAILPVLQLAVNQAYQVARISLQLQDAVNPVAMTRVLYLLTKAFGTYAAEEGFWQGDGLIWEIANDKKVQAAITEHEKLSLNELWYVIDPIQKAIAAHAINEEQKQQHSLAEAILSLDGMKRFIHTLHMRFAETNTADDSAQPKVNNKTSGLTTVLLLIAGIFTGKSGGHEPSDEDILLERTNTTDVATEKLAKRWENFYDPEDGFDLALYIAAITALIDMKKINREVLKDALNNNTLGTALPQMMQGLPNTLLEPARIETLLHRQSGEQAQAFVESLNNGFDALGDAIGRFGRGGFQINGLLQDEGDTVTYYTVPEGDKRSRYTITFTMSRDGIRIRFLHEDLEETHASGTEVVLRTKRKLPQAAIKRYIQKKMGHSHRGQVFFGENRDELKLVNDLRSFRHGIDKAGHVQTVEYRLGDKAVRYWFDGDGALHIRDYGTGMAPLKELNNGTSVSVILESLPVPYISTNRTSSGLQTALRHRDWSADGDTLFYSGQGTSQKTVVTIEVGGTEVETIELTGARLPDEVVIDLPTAAGQLESRSQILLDEVTVAAFKDIIGRYIGRFKDNPEEYAAVMNALSLLMTRLQNSDRAKSKNRTDNLETYIRTLMQEAVKDLNQQPEVKEALVMVPNLAEEYLDAELLAQRNQRPVYLNEELLAFDPAKIGGEQVAARGKSVWKVDSLAVPYVRVGKSMILLQAAVYDYFMKQSRRFGDKGSLLLNLLFGLWISYGERPAAEVELTGNKREIEAHESANAVTLDLRVQRLLDGAHIPAVMRAQYEPIVRFGLASDRTDEDIIQRLRRLAQIVDLTGLFFDTSMDFLTAFGTRFPEEQLRKAILMGDKTYYHTWKNKQNIVRSIDTAGRVLEIPLLYECRFSRSFSLSTGAGHLLVQSAANDEIFAYNWYEIDSNGTMRNLFPGLSASAVIKEAYGRIYFTVAEKQTSDQGMIYVLSKDGQVTRMTLPQRKEQRGPSRGGVTIDGDLYLPVPLFNVKYKLASDVIGVELYRIGAGGMPERLLSTAASRNKYSPISYIYTLFDHHYIDIMNNGEWATYEVGAPVQNQGRYKHVLEGDGYRYVYEVTSEEKKNLYRQDVNGKLTLVIDHADYVETYTGQENTRYVRVHHDDTEHLYRMQKSGELTEVLSVKGSIFLSQIQGQDFARVRDDDAGSALYTLSPAGNNLMVSCMPNEFLSLDRAGERVLVEITDVNSKLIKLYALQTNALQEIQIPATTFLRSFKKIGNHFYLICSPESDFSLRQLYELFPDNSVHKIVALPAKISFFDDLPCIMLEDLEDSGGLTVFPLDLLNAINPSSSLPDQEAIAELSNGRSAEEKQLLFSNLVRYTWTEQELQGIGWLLPLVQGVNLKDLDGTARALLQQMHGLDQGYQRQIGTFMDNLARHGVVGQRYSDVLVRWLRLFDADRDRAVRIVAQLSATVVPSSGQESSVSANVGWEYLRADFAKEQVPETQVMVRYLRNELNLVPLTAAQEERIPVGESQGAVRDILLSTLAGLAQNTGMVRNNGNTVEINDVQNALQRMPGVLPFTENAIQRNIIVAGYEWLRENIQNSIKAILERAEKEPGGIDQDHRTIAVTAVPVVQGNSVRLEVCMRDKGKGMDVADILQYLLALDRTSYREGENPADGFNGRGWYRNLSESDRVRVVSGKPGSTRFIVLEAYREQTPDGFTWRVDRFEEFAGKFEGTEMAWIKEYPGSFEQNRTALELEAAVIADSLQMYAGMLPYFREHAIDITFNGKSIAEQVVTVAEEPWAGDEKILILSRSSGHAGIVQDGYFVMGLDQDPSLWELVPDFLKNVMAEECLTLALPRSIILDRERAGLAEKQDYIEKLQQAIQVAVLKAAAYKLKYDLPQDYLYRPEDTRHQYPVAEFAAAEINRGQGAAVSQNILADIFKSSANRIHLLTNLKVFSVDGRSVSLEDIHRLEQKAAHPDNASPSDTAIDEALPSNVYRMIAGMRNNPAAMQFLVATAEQARPRLRNPADMSAAERMLAQLISKIMTPLVNEQLNRKTGIYRVSFGDKDIPSNVAGYGADWLALNAKSQQVQNWVAWFELCTERKTNAVEDYAMLWEIVEFVLHEHSHAVTDTAEETHNEAFRQQMVQQALELVRLQVVPEELAKDMQQDTQNKLAAILPANLPAYLQTVATLHRYFVPEILAKLIGLSIVHLKEYPIIMQGAHVFDEAHGLPTAQHRLPETDGQTKTSRQALAEQMHQIGHAVENYMPVAFRAVGSVAIGAGLLAGGGTLVAFAGCGLLAIAGATKGAIAISKMLTGILHVQYDMKAPLPMAFFVAEDVGKLTGVTFDPKQYLPVVITAIAGNESKLTTPGTSNLGITAGKKPAWVRQEDGVMVVYVAGTGQNFADAASEVITAFVGYGNIGADPRLLIKLGVQSADTPEAMVFDYTSGKLKTGDLLEIPVLPGVDITAGIGALRNLDQAHRNACVPEMGIERSWSDALLKIEQFNSSLVVTAADLDAMTASDVEELQGKGAKVYVHYDGQDAEQATAVLHRAQACGVDGLLAPHLDAEAIEALSTAAAKQQTMFMVAGSMTSRSPSRRGYYTVDFTQGNYAQQIDALRNVEYPVVKVTLGKSFGPKEHQALQNLPYSSMVIFSADNVCATVSRDTTEFEIFGANLLRTLYLKPRTRAEQRAYQERVVYELDFGEFEVPEDIAGYINTVQSGTFNLDLYKENTELLEAVRLHRLGEQDTAMQEVFTQTFLKRLKARIMLSKYGNQSGLEDSILEKAFADSLELSELKEIKGMQFKAEGTPEQVDLALHETVHEWEKLTDQNTKKTRAAELAGLILHYARRRIGTMNITVIKATDLRTTNAILSAA